MKTRNVLFFSVFFLMLSSAMAETIRIDAFTSFRAYVYNGEKVHQKLSFLQEGPDGRPATRLTWDSGKKTMPKSISVRHLFFQIFSSWKLIWNTIQMEADR